MLSCDQLLRGWMFITIHQQYVFYGRSFYIFMCIHDFVCLYSGPVAVLCVWWIQCCFLQGEKKEFCDCNLDLFEFFFYMLLVWFMLVMNMMLIHNSEGGRIILHYFPEDVLEVCTGIWLWCWWIIELFTGVFVPCFYFIFMLGVELVCREFWYYCHCSINNL